MLQRYELVIIDDCHDRSVNTDVVLGLIKMIRRKRPELKLVISSATIDTELYKNFFASEGTKIGIFFI